jgi:hypothetical protein
MAAIMTRFCVLDRQYGLLLRFFPNGMNFENTEMEIN